MLTNHNGGSGINFEVPFSGPFLASNAGSADNS